ncbi:MAG: AtpZ/AtpI family protein [Abditibacteriota bacterium]|nr:AtpZ/AtpI family protein [Abditibacteriota bacterium]
MRGLDKNSLKALADVGSIGLLNCIAILIGMGMGYALDKVFGTYPTLTFVFVLFGLSAGIYESVGILKKAIERSNEDEDD